MRVLMVGGAVRDLILGRQPSDFDFLVEGATLDEFLGEFPGARQVGKDFPVFLVDGHEYAFARTEKSTGRKHVDFAVSTENVTVLEDLQRRDLTINALAMCPESGALVGDARCIADMQSRVLRHVGPAFTDDPLRVFRVARFASQLSGFSVDRATMGLMAAMKHMLPNLPAERVFGELEKALKSDEPWRFFEVLHAAECLDWWFPEVEAMFGGPVGERHVKHYGERDIFDHVVNALKRLIDKSPVLRFAVLMHDVGKILGNEKGHLHDHDKDGVAMIETMCARLKAPAVFTRSAVTFCRHHMRMHRVFKMRPGKVAAMLCEIEKNMAYGVAGFMFCAIGDGFPVVEAGMVLRAADEVLAVRLPEKYHHLGKGCRELKLQFQGEAWKQAVKSMN